MSQTERLYKLKSWFDAGKCLSKARLLEDLGISPATLKRDLAHLRDRMNAPVVHDRELGGWRLDRSEARVGTQYELPGLWFSAEEIHALLTMHHLLANLDAGGLLRPHIAPLVERLNKALGASGGAKVRASADAKTHAGSGSDTGTHASEEIVRRIRVQTVGARKLHLPHFQAVGTALLQRRRLHIDYHGRGRNERREREVSPQRLIHYRDNWYLDAWCHVKRGLRSFAVDAIQAARVLDRKAIDVSESDLDAVLGAGYGIFAGRKVQWARLRFTAERARWVAAETWHPKQRGRFEADGTYLLELPYADPRELVMDILRHVPEVEVLGPAGLREEVAQKVRAGVEKIVGKLTP
jgi:predicted DNA-binding transcriptional regulator YafY